VFLEDEKDDGNDEDFAEAAHVDVSCR